MKPLLDLLIALLLLATALFALDANQSSEVKSQKLEVTQQEQQEAEQHQNALEKIQSALNQNTMHARYNNHQTYLEIQEHLKTIKKEIKKKKNLRDKKGLSELSIKYKSLENQLDLLGDFKEEPFLKLTKPNDIAKAPKITSPFDIFGGFAYLKILKKEKEEYAAKVKSLLTLIDTLQEEERHIHALQKRYGKNYKKEKLQKVDAELEDVMNTFDLVSTTNQIYNQKLHDSILKTTEDIKEQVKKLFKILSIIVAILLFSFVLKYFAKKTIKDNERYYMANKGINFSNLVLIALVLLFSFLENATYLVTVLGFASAGIAIAMKDLFMSSLGWLVIVFGGSFHVGDRVKVFKGSHSYVGDIVDISFLRMTILEDITYTTIKENGRAGRIIFIPNNYIFTELIANYTHGKIKTVWDGIDIMITFDSNHKKATHIIKEIVKKYSKGYTDISRKQLNALRNQYSLKNINVEPRIYTFVEGSGIRVSCYYMTNSYATLTLRSNIFANIIDEINAEADIKIAYDTHIINVKRDATIVQERRDEGEESLS